MNIENAILINCGNDFYDGFFEKLCNSLEEGQTVEVYIDCIGHTRNNLVQETYKEKLTEKYGDNLFVKKNDGAHSFTYYYQLSPKKQRHKKAPYQTPEVTQEPFFDNPNGYTAVYTDETIEKRKLRSSGRPYIRFNIVPADNQDGEPIVSNITAAELQKYQEIAAIQGNNIQYSPLSTESNEQSTKTSIKSLRDKTRFTQTEFGKFAGGIPSSTIQNWELGLRDCPEYLLHLIEYKLKGEKIIP